MHIVGVAAWLTWPSFCLMGCARERSFAMSTPQTPLADLRMSYQKAQLTEDQAHADPAVQFAQWLDQALTAQVPEPNAMTLATVGPDLRPSTRVVLIKGLSAQGIVWYTHYTSRKGADLAGNPFAALQFHWVELERVVRIEGRVQPLDAAQSDAYFASRPLASRIGAWASEQSQVVASRGSLDTAFAQRSAQLGDAPPRPPHWGGYVLVPDRWEFWQGRPSRMHDRLQYRQHTQGGQTQWLQERLAP